MAEQANFLYLMVDQQRADWLGRYGHPRVSTKSMLFESLTRHVIGQMDESPQSSTLA